MNALVEQLKRSPRLRLVLDELQQTLDEEAAARQRFRDATHEDVRAEFINGEVIEHVTAREKHNRSVTLMARLLSTLASVRRLGVVREQHALTTFTRNDYLPDIAFWSTQRSADFEADQVVYPPPDLIVEVLSPTTVSLDRGVKLDDYAAHGVREYWLADPDARTLEQLLLKGDAYDLAFKSTNGAFTSPTLGGFEMPVAAAFDDDANLTALWSLAPRPA